MKKLFVIAIAAITLASFSSCTKSYDCNCTTTNSTTGAKTTNTYTYVAKSKDAQSVCDAYESSYYYSTTTCDLK